jgi:Flp pilus assembly pilin Flp
MISMALQLCSAACHDRHTTCRDWTRLSRHHRPHDGRLAAASEQRVRIHPGRVRLDERGQAILEYAMIVAVVGACLVAILGLVGRATHKAYTQTAATVGRQATSTAAYGGGQLGGGGGVRGIPAGIPGAPEDPADSSAADSAGDDHGGR